MNQVKKTLLFGSNTAYNHFSGRHRGNFCSTVVSPPAQTHIIPTSTIFDNLFFPIFPTKTQKLNDIFFSTPETPF